MSADFLEQIGLERPDGPIYHYTTVEAAEKILRSGRLRASLSSDLNDLGEVTFGWERVRAWLETRTDLDGSAVYNAMREAAEDAALDSEEGDEYFRKTWHIVSASTEPDSAAQWLAYGAGGAGVALGIDPDAALVPVSSDASCIRAWSHPRDPIWSCRSSASTSPWLKVVYDSLAQEHLVQKFHDLHAELRAAQDPPDDEEGWIEQGQMLRAEIRSDLWALVSFFKHASFAFECEARLVVNTAAHAFFKYEVRSHTFRRYVELMTPVQTSGPHGSVAHDQSEPLVAPLPITKVTLGSRHRGRTIAAAAVKHFAAESELRDLEVRLSTSPLR